MVSPAGAVTIPIVVVSGLPLEVVAPPAVAFWHLLVSVIVLSVIFAGALLYWARQHAPNDVDVLPIPGPLPPPPDPLDRSPFVNSPPGGATAGLDGEKTTSHQDLHASVAFDSLAPGVTPHRSRSRSGQDPSLLLTGLRSVRRGNDERQSVLHSHKPRKHVSYGAVDLEAPMTPFAPPTYRPIH
jgi:hypothetical protein